jgi:glycosyltransferase involved in cell wall biosynthesis
MVLEAHTRTRAFDADAPCLRISAPEDQCLFVGRGPRMGYIFFEGNKLRPFERHYLGQLDVVAVASEWAANVLEANGLPRGRIRVAPAGVDRAIFHEGVAPMALKTRTPQTTVFANVGKWDYRKGHDFVLTAFNAAFTAQDDVLLVMNCFNPFVFEQMGFDGPKQSREWEQKYLDSPLGRAGRIAVVKQRLPDQFALASLMAAADCGFFPARNEGWNLDLAEMLAMGKHGIATDYSGHTEYARAAGALLIDIDALEAADDGCYFRGEQGEWAALGSRQLEQAAAHLRAVHRRKQEGELGLNRAGVEAFQRLTWRNTARRLTGAA